jgi:hypothetical protein
MTNAITFFIKYFVSIKNTNQMKLPHNTGVGLIKFGKVSVESGAPLNWYQ